MIQGMFGTPEIFMDMVRQGYQPVYRPRVFDFREIVELIVGSNRQDMVTPVIWAYESYHAAQQQAEELSRSQAVIEFALDGTVPPRLPWDQLGAIEKWSWEKNPTPRKW